MKKWLFFLLTGVSIIAGCSSNSDESSPIYLNTANINREGCLNVERLIKVLYSSGLLTHSLSTTVDLRVNSAKYIRANFKHLLVLGTFEHTRRGPGDLSEFIGVKQEACTAVYLSGSTSEPREFKVTQASENRLEFTDEEENRLYNFEFLPPSILELTVDYATADYNCDLNNTPVKVRYTKRIHFETDGQSLPTQEILSPALIQDLVDLPLEENVLLDLRQQIAIEGPLMSLDSAQLRALTALEIPPWLLQCTANENL